MSGDFLIPTKKEMNKKMRDDTNSNVLGKESISTLFKPKFKGKYAKDLTIGDLRRFNGGYSNGFN